MVMVCTPPVGPRNEASPGSYLNCSNLIFCVSLVQQHIISFLDPPVFNKVRCKVNNTTVLLGWFPPETKSCVDYYVLEVDMVKTSEYATRRKKDRKFKRLYEGPAREYALYSVPYSVKIISRVYGVNPTGDGTPSEELVLSTPKGMWFGAKRSVFEEGGVGKRRRRERRKREQTVLNFSRFCLVLNL